MVLLRNLSPQLLLHEHKIDAMNPLLDPRSIFFSLNSFHHSLEAFKLFFNTEANCLSLVFEGFILGLTGKKKWLSVIQRVVDCSDFLVRSLQRIKNPLDLFSAAPCRFQKDEPSDVDSINESENAHDACGGGEATISAGQARIGRYRGRHD